MAAANSGSVGRGKRFDPVVRPEQTAANTRPKPGNTTGQASPRSSKA